MKWKNKIKNEAWTTKVIQNIKKLPEEIRFTSEEAFGKIKKEKGKEEQQFLEALFIKMKKMEYYGTLGPSCAKEEILMDMFEAGMTGIRLNLSHKSLKESKEWVDIYQNAAKKCGKKADLLIDLIGPEFRIGEVIESRLLEEG